MFRHTQAQRGTGPPGVPGEMKRHPAAAHSSWTPDKSCRVPTPFGSRCPQAAISPHSLHMWQEVRPCQDTAPRGPNAGPLRS